MSRITGVIVALATAATAAAGAGLAGSGAAESTAERPPVASAGELPREIPGGVEVTLADGDRFKATVSRDLRTVWGARYDAATGAWGERRVVFTKKGVYCGDVDVRAAGSSVAMIAECDRGGWSEDQAPTHSQALYSPDMLTWRSFTLPGEAYDEPGISPSGTAAIWPLHHGWATYTSGGFEVVERDLPGQEYSITGTISDAGDVSVLYGDGQGDGCVLSVLTLTATGTETRQQLDVDNACGDVDLTNTDALTVYFGDIGQPESRATISRPDTASPWAVSAIAPNTAPGLDPVDGRLGTQFFTSPGQPLYAIGSAGRRLVRAQTYDPASQIWGRARTVYDAGRARCSWGDNWWAEPPSVVVVALTCGGRNVLLTPRADDQWQALRMGRHPYGVSADGRYVAAPGRSSTAIISRELGVVTLPGGVSGRCDVVVPDGPDAAVLLTAAGRHRGWPSVLKASTTSGWKTLARTTLPRFPARCREAESSNLERPYRFSIHSRWAGYAVRLVRTAEGWDVRRSRY